MTQFSDVRERFLVARKTDVCADPHCQAGASPFGIIEQKIASKAIKYTFWTFKTDAGDYSALPRKRIFMIGVHIDCGPEYMDQVKYLINKMNPLLPESQNLIEVVRAVKQETIEKRIAEKEAHIFSTFIFSHFHHSPFDFLVSKL